MKPSERANINRQNAAHSTGPVTPEGKRRSSLNALRHGLTGQTVLLPEDDMTAYQKASREFYAELKPSGILERKAVQTIVDTHWRLDRIRAMENNLFALGFHDLSAKVSAPDATSHAALAQARYLESHTDVLVRLSVYEKRLNRTLIQAKAELKQLQLDRRKVEEQACEDARRIFNLKKAQGQSWKPEDAGFEFSSEHLAAWTSRLVLAKQANDFHYLGRLPD